jgi:hypothetical protein
VHGGTFREEDLNAGRAGTATAPIRLKVAPAERAVVTGIPGGTRPFFVLNQPHWVLDGVEVDGKGQVGNAVRIRSHHVVVSNIEAHDCNGPSAIWFRGAAHAALLDSTVHDQRNDLEDGHGILIRPDCASVLVADPSIPTRRRRGAVSVGRRFSRLILEPVPPTNIWILDNRFERDRGNGSKYHTLCDANGLPLHALLSAANTTTARCSNRCSRPILLCGVLRPRGQLHVVDSSATNPVHALVGAGGHPTALATPRPSSRRRCGRPKVDLQLLTCSLIPGGDASPAQ